MLDQEDLKWIAATSTELNSILQQVSRYADLARRHRGEHKYIDLLGERVEFASKAAQSLFDRVTSKILAGAVRKTAAARKSEAGFTVMPPPAAATDDEPRRSIRTSRKGEQKHGTSADAKQSTTASENGVPPGVRVENPNGNREYLLLIEDEPDVAAAERIWTDLARHYPTDLTSRWLLLEQALLIEGVPIENPGVFVQRLNRVLTRAV